MALKRIGAVGLEASHAVGVPNVVRNPMDVPTPINRTEPTTVKVTLTIEEVTAELANGTTYDFWTFEGTVPGPMLRVMEGDTVELTIVNPTDSIVSHNIDLHAVNGTWYVPPGSVSVFEFGLNEPGNYVLVDHALYRAGKGALGILQVSGEHDDEVYSPAP